MNRLKLFVTVAAIAAMTALPSVASAATLTLTGPGAGLGFVLTTFVTTDLNGTGCCLGPFGVAVANNGHVLVNDGNNGSSIRYEFLDVDNQTLANAIGANEANAGYYTGYATAGGQAYGAATLNGAYVQFNGDGTVNHTLTGVPNSDLGLWGLPNGHLLAMSSAGVINIDPLANAGLGSYTLLNATYFGDGLSAAPDGSRYYLAYNQQVLAFNTATGALITAYNTGCSDVDGTGVISAANPALNGQIVANCNDGNVQLIDPVTGTSVRIATGGARGDYTAPDTNNGTLFLTSSDRVYRLSCGDNCSIGTAPPSVPEPTTMVLLGTGLALVAARRLRRSAR